ncbi:MAG: right-handed parallel beta-helix repeat-containing protein [Chitinophagales bacterium]|nr:right-handed parallel beta-helix repeat-containing protein [Chitinophagales bacterium]MDW8393789.1 right-handed parallel beta-helix repeat-containing protein [Chitinophagales bacterium]
MHTHYFFLAFLISCLPPAQAANYYLSASGNDAASGTSPNDAWRSLAKLNTVVLYPGDSVFFACGSIFEGQLFLNYSGSENAPIYLGPYGNGTLPVLSGTISLNGWTLHAPNIYKTAVASFVAQVLINQQRATCARFPNSGFLRMTTTFGDSAFSCSSLNQPEGHWNGASARFRLTPARWFSAPVAEFLHPLQAEPLIKLSAFTPAPLYANSAFYLDNHYAAMDTSGEWYYDPANTTLYLFSPTDPDGSLHVAASVFAYGLVVTAGVTHVHINRLHVAGQQVAGIWLQPGAAHIQVTGCHFTSQLAYGLRAESSTTHVALDSCLFEDIAGIAVSLYQAQHPVIRHGRFQRIGLTPGWGSNADNVLSALECAGCDSAWIQYNRMDSIGNMGLYAGLNHSLVYRNIFHQTLLWTNQVGAVYVYATNEKNNLLENNIVTSVPGESSYFSFGQPAVAGFFLDGPVSNWTLSGNTITYADFGIRLSRGATGTLMRNNLIYACRSSQLLIQEGEQPGLTSGHKLFSNVFFALNPSTDVVRLESPFPGFMPLIADSNRYWNPYRYVFLLQTTPPPGPDFPRYFTLPMWQQHSGMDAASNQSYLYRTRYRILDTLSSELITNGHFTSNFDGWTNEHPALLSMLLDNSTPLDFGCLKLAFISSATDTFSGVKNKSFPTDSGTYYALHISTVGNRHGSLLVKIKNDIPPYYYLTPPVPVPFGPERLNCEFVFAADNGFDKTRFSIELSSADSLVWLDNISMHNVNVAGHRPESFFRLFVNETDQAQEFLLGDTLFYDLDQQPVTQSVSVPPYSGIVLIFDSSLINAVSYSTDSFFFSAWPNPARAGQSVRLSRVADGQPAELIGYDLLGRPAWYQRWPAGQATLHMELPRWLSSGCYVLLIRQTDTSAALRLIVQ